MPEILERKMNTGMGILILLILMYVGLSFMDCKMSMDNVWNESIQAYEYVTISADHNVSWTLIVCAIAQIVLILCKQFRLQLIPGTIAAASGLLMPLSILANNMLDVVVYVVAGPVHYHMEVPQTGWIVVVFAGIVLIASILAANFLTKLKKIISAEKQTPTESEDYIV